MVESITQRIVNRYNRIYNQPPIDGSGVPAEFQAGLYKTELKHFLTEETNPIEFFAGFVNHVRAETSFAFHGRYITNNGLAELATNTEKYPFFSLWLEMGSALKPYQHDRWNKQYFPTKSGRYDTYDVPKPLRFTDEEYNDFREFNTYVFWLPQKLKPTLSLPLDSTMRTDFQNRVLQVSQVHNSAYRTMYKLLATGPVIAALPKQGSVTAVKNWMKAFNLFESLESEVQAVKESKLASLSPVN